MKPDSDLTFLATCPNGELRTLCDILTHDKDGELRLSEQMSNSSIYLRCYPQHMALMAKEVGEELRRFGSNTLMTLYRRGEADSYKTIVQRVCRKMNVKVCDDDSTPAMERSLLLSLCESATQKMSDEELRNMATTAGIPHKNLNRQLLIGLLMSTIRSNMRLMAKLACYITSRILQVLLGRSVMMIGLGTVGRYLGTATGPLGWALLAGWTVKDLASPSYRVIVPAVIQVAAMRARQTSLLT